MPRIAEKTKQFMRGYACAISCIVAGHGEDTCTREALIAGGIRTRQEAEKYGVDINDLEILYPNKHNVHSQATGSL